MTDRSTRPATPSVLLALWVLAACAGAARAEVAVVADGRAVVRVEPREDAPALARPAQGSSVHVVARDGDWARVQLAGGVTGWVRADALGEVATPPLPPAPARPVREPASPEPAIAPQPETEVERLRRELAETEARHAGELVALRAEHEASQERFIDYVTKRHEDALERDKAALDAAWKQRFVEEQARHEAEIRKVSKQSGWQSEFDRAVREAVAEREKDFEMRCDARARGLEMERERAVAAAVARAASDCEAQRMTAVNEALATVRLEAEERRRADIAREAERCQLALQLVLERAAAGESLDGVRALAEGAVGQPATPASGPQ